MDLHDIPIWLEEARSALSTAFLRLPGSGVLLRYIRSSYQDDPIRSLIELFLCLFAVRYLLAPSYSTAKAGHVRLSEKEIDELVDEWTPEPLVGEITAAEEAEMERVPIIIGPTAPKTKLANGRTVSNLASFNFYNFNSNETLKEKAIETMRTYGVGPCGPPGFYGTQDVHMRTEADIAAHLGTEGCILYAQSFSTISSVIPAFSKRGDVIVADRGVNFAIRKGLQISRSQIRWYEHNDMNDLERVLARVAKEQSNKKLTRRFIVTEGLFEDTGDTINLPEIIELKLKYKFRLILDETWSYGVLGRTGRGLTEQQNVDAAAVDMIIGSLAGPLCAGGGFCAGSRVITEHQRLCAAAYTFSAALPAMLATTASETIALLQAQPEIVAQSREATRLMWAQIEAKSEWARCTSAPENPMVVVALRPEVVAARKLSWEEMEEIMGEVVDETLANGVLIAQNKAVRKASAGNEPDTEAPPALRICVTTGLSKKEIEKAGITIRHAIAKVMKSRKG